MTKNKSKETDHLLGVPHTAQPWGYFFSLLSPAVQMLNKHPVPAKMKTRSLVN